MEEVKLIEIISKMTMEEIYKDKEKFAFQVQEVAALDLEEMGWKSKPLQSMILVAKMDIYKLLVKRDALIAEAEANKETKIKTAEANRLGQAAFIISETQISEFTKDKELKVQLYRKEQETEKAKADLA